MLLYIMLDDDVDVNDDDDDDDDEKQRIIIFVDNFFLFINIMNINVIHFSPKNKTKK